MVNNNALIYYTSGNYNYNYYHYNDKVHKKYKEYLMDLVNSEITVMNMNDIPKEPLVFAIKTGETFPCACLVGCFENKEADIDIAVRKEHRKKGIAHNLTKCFFEIYDNTCEGYRITACAYTMKKLLHILGFSSDANGIFYRKQFGVDLHSELEKLNCVSGPR